MLPRRLRRQLASADLDVAYAGLPVIWTPPGGHHATSVLLHSLNSMLLFLVLQRMTGRSGAAPWWRRSLPGTVARRIGRLGFRAQRCAERLVSDSDDLGLRPLCGRVQNPKSQLQVFYALALFFFALGLMAKPMLVTLPFVLLLLDWWPLGRVPQDDQNQKPFSN